MKIDVPRIVEMARDRKGEFTTAGLMNALRYEFGLSDEECRQLVEASYSCPFVGELIRATEKILNKREADRIKEEKRIEYKVLVKLIKKHNNQYRDWEKLSWLKRVFGWEPTAIWVHVCYLDKMLKLKQMYGFHVEGEEDFLLGRQQC